MKTIGEILKQRRLELGYSIEDIHDKTKLSPVHIKAIEDGDLDYFRHDLSYLKFFVQYYCQAVYLDFDEIKDDYEKVLNNYYETQAIKKIESTQASNENIKRRIKNQQSNYKEAKGARSIQFQKVENQTVFMFIIIAVLVALLLFGFFKLVLPRLTSEPNQPDVVDIETPEGEPEPEPEVVVEPQPEPEPEPEPEPVEPITSTMTDASNYQISNVTSESQFIIRFTGDTWIQAYINGTAVADPATGVYGAGQEIVIPLDGTVQTVSFEFGNLVGSTFFVDETAIELDPLTLGSAPILVNFHIEGE